MANGCSVHENALFSTESCSIHTSFGEHIILLAKIYLHLKGWYDFIDAVSTADIV